jgi:alkaline phosphatase D
VEFAGTAVSSPSLFQAGITPAAANVISKKMIDANADLQWSEASYRGFFTLTVAPEQVTATYYAMNNISYANLDGFVSAVFQVKAGNYIFQVFKQELVLRAVLQRITS